MPRAAKRARAARVSAPVSSTRRERRCEAAGLDAEQRFGGTGRADRGGGDVAPSAQARHGQLRRRGRGGEAGNDGFVGRGRHRLGLRGGAEALGHQAGCVVDRRTQESGDSLGHVAGGVAVVIQAEGGEQAREIGEADREALGGGGQHGQRNRRRLRRFGEPGAVEAFAGGVERREVQHEAGCVVADAAPDRRRGRAAAVQQHLVEARGKRDLDARPLGPRVDRADPCRPRPAPG